MSDLTVMLKLVIVKHTSVQKLMDDKAVTLVIEEQVSVTLEKGCLYN